MVRQGATGEATPGTLLMSDHTNRERHLDFREIVDSRLRFATSTDESEVLRSNWLTYAQAAAYCGWSVNYVRNLVCAGAIPVYGKPRRRRFRRDMLDRFLTDPDAAMRLFRAERQSHGS
jgi:excisionase family DNA binding protein